MELTQDKAKELFEYRDGALFWKAQIQTTKEKYPKGKN
jgi:hypothetical protein